MLTDALISANVGRACARDDMALALESHLRTVIGNSCEGAPPGNRYRSPIHDGYERLKEKQLSAIEKFVSGQDVPVSSVWKLIGVIWRWCTEQATQWFQVALCISVYVGSHTHPSSPPSLFTMSH